MAPSDFTLLGASNGSSWSTIYTKSDEIWTSTNPKTYYVPTTSKFTDLAFVFSKVGSNATYGNAISLAELQFYGQ